MSQDNEPHTQITIAEQDVIAQGFTETGQKQFCDTVVDYGNTLLKRSCDYADLEKANNMEREVTHTHVKNAAHSLTINNINKTSHWRVLAHVAEYLVATGLGVGASNLNEIWGIILFGICVITLSILVATRLSGRNKNV